MGFGIASDGLLGHAYLGSLIVGAAILFMVARVFLLRIRLLLAQRRSARFLARWRPLLSERAVVPRPCKDLNLPHLAKRDQLRFVNLWLSLQESLADEAHDRLNHIARRLNVHRIAQRYLQQKNVSQRLAAVIFLGHLKDRSSWETLAALLRDDNPVISIMAARSLMQIDPGRAVSLVFAELLQREDWPAERVGLVFRHTLVPELADTHLTALLVECDDETAIKLLPNVDFMHHEQRDVVLLNLLRHSRSDRLTSRVLKKVENPNCLELVRRYAGYSRWHVRMQAVAALGRIGGREADVVILRQRLGDEQWWVRYRAAQALVRLLRAVPAELHAIAGEHRDPFARQILTQVLIEEGLRHA